MNTRGVNILSGQGDNVHYADTPSCMRHPDAACIRIKKVYMDS